MGIAVPAVRDDAHRYTGLEEDDGSVRVTVRDDGDGFDVGMGARAARRDAVNSPAARRAAPTGE